MPGNTASLTFRLFGVDVNASKTISNVGAASAGTAKQLEVLSTGTLKFVAAAGAAGIASVGLAGALGVGLGGAFAAVGVGAALLNKNVQKEFKDLGTGIKNQISGFAKPVQDAMLGLAKYTKTAFATMKPLFQNFFQAVAPLVTIFGQGLVKAIANAVGEFTPLVKVVTPIVKELFNQLPDLIGNIAAALQMILQPLSGNTAAFGQLLQILGSVIGVAGAIISSLVRLGQQIMPTFGRAVTTVAGALNTGLAKVLPLVGKAIQTMLPHVAGLIASLLRLAAQILPVLLPVLSKVVVTLADAAAKVLPQILPSLSAIVTAFARLLPAITPLIAPVLYLVKSVSNLIQPLAEVAGQIIAAVAPALKQLLPVIVSVSTQVGAAFSKAFAQAAPSLVRLADALGQILIALTPLIPAFAAAVLAFTPLIPAAAKIAAVLAEGLVPIVSALAPIIQKLAPAIVAVAVAAKLWSVAQAALNVVLAANPIGIVIIAIAALAAGLIYAYKHSTTFRNIVQTTFKVIAAAARFMWEVVVRPTLFALANAFLTVAGTIVHAAATAFGWIPGLGPKLRGAAAAFDTFKRNVLGALNQIPNTKNINVSVSGVGATLAQLRQIRSEMAATGSSVTARLIRGGAAQTGMLLPGYGGGDIIPIMAEPGEAVIPKHLVPQIMPWARSHGIPGFATGGIVGGGGGGASTVINIKIGTAIGSDLRKASADLLQGIREDLRRRGKTATANLL